LFSWANYEKDEISKPLCKAFFWEREIGGNREDSIARSEGGQRRETFKEKIAAVARWDPTAYF